MNVREAAGLMLLSCALFPMTGPGLQARPPSGSAQSRPSGFAAAQSRPPQSPTRDNAPTVAGTAMISGTVVTDDANSQPLRRVTVMLASGGLQMPQGTLTDDAGRFRFVGVLPGNYTIATTRAGYVPAFYGAKQPGKGPGIPIAVLDGQRIDNIRVRMLHGGVITGTIRSARGQPAAGLGVQVLQVQMVDGQRRIASSAAALQALAGGPTATDDRGVYRVYGLAPGEYLVQTQMRGSSGVMSSEVRQVTAGEVQWAQQAIAQAPGGVPTPGGPALAPAPAPGQTVSYSSVYYPGTTVAVDAMTITLGANEERRGVDFSTQLVPTAKITGNVLDPDGRPLQGVAVSLKSSAPDSYDIVGLMLGDGMARTAADGTFSLSGVRPGRYALTARGAPRPEGRQPAAAGSLDAILGARADAGAAAAAGLAGLFGGGGSLPWWASEDIAVDGRDLTDLTLRLQPGLTVSGRIVFEGTTIAPPADVTKTRVSLGGVPTSSSPIEMAASMMLGTSMATTAADGTFVAKGVTPGKYRASVAGPGMLFGPMAQALMPAASWTLKSIMWRGRDVADIPFEVRPNEDVTGLLVTMIDRPTELSGAVIDQAGRATGSFPIVVFSTDRASWTIGSRRVQQARPANDGKFKFVGLPAGEYYVCAVTDLDPEDLYSASFLDQLVTGAFKIRLADGEKRVQDLKLSGSGVP